jgi:chromosome segregation ATPase
MVVTLEQRLEQAVEEYKQAEAKITEFENALEELRNYREQTRGKVATLQELIQSDNEQPAQEENPKPSERPRGKRRS